MPEVFDGQENTNVVERAHPLKNAEKMNTDDLIHIKKQNIAAFPFEMLYT